MTVDPYLDSITLENGDLRFIVAPRLGGSVVAFDRVGTAENIEIFRRTAKNIESALECAMPVMLPWVNRISGGGIIVDGELQPISPNVPGERFPIHGNAFKSEWQVLGRSHLSVGLELSSNGPGPYAYDARYDLALDGPALTARIELVNRAADTLPFGIGFHPWFPRTPRTTLEAFATDIWLEDERYIPTRSVSVEDLHGFDFRKASRLPGGWINNSFVGWNGAAKIAWPERHLRLSIRSQHTACYHVYSPNDEAGFFCFETQTQIPDAARLLQAGDVGAPDWLGSGAVMVHEVRFEVMS
jgi:aldose 1-epimerase